MKVYSIKYILIVAVLAIPFSSCDDFLDVNTDPNRVTSVTLEALLPTTIEATSSAHYSISNTVSQITQHIGSYFGYPEFITLNSSWSTIYLKALGNLDQLTQEAEAQSSPYYAGIGKVLQALNLGLLTDSWEAVPFSEAFQGSDNFTPVYDTQESNYNSINQLLNDAINDLQATESVFVPAGDDLAYGGDIDKWLKLAYTLKARYAIHLTNKDQAKFAADALTAIANGMESNDDDFQLTYNSVNKNPWHTNVALANNTGNLTVAQGAYLVDVMKNTTADGDPRLAALTDAGGIPFSDIIGLNSFDENAPANNTDFSESTWHSTETAPILMVTYAEAKFIEAEAALLSNDADAAYTAYLEGIRASMEKLGVDGSAYLADPAVAVGADNLTLALIMKEKYIALFLNPETWVDMRRYDYDTAVYPGFEVPDPLGNIGGSIKRVRYPNDEFDRNGGEAMRNNKPAIEPMWRDQ